MEAPPNEIAKLSRLIEASQSVVAFTGAGISTECGIPDFRSPGGLWTKYKPIEFSEFLASPETRLEAWRRYFKLYDEVRNARPGRGHRAIATLVASGKATHVITQNIDNLHQESGVPGEKILELHGNGTFARCLSCGERHELAWARQEIERFRRPPHCLACDGIVKTATISFGQAMPEIQMARAQDETMRCDLFIVLGSSLVVYPAAGFPRIAKRKGAKLVIVNRDATDQDDDADLVIRAEIGPTMSKAVGVN